MTNLIYCEEDENNDIPILITDYLNGIMIESRTYYRGVNRGCIWHPMTWEQAKKLRDNLSDWLIENPKRVSE